MERYKKKDMLQMATTLIEASRLTDKVLKSSDAVEMLAQCQE